MDNNTIVIGYLIDYIEEHITYEISLDILSNASGYSQYHMHRMFTGLVGSTISIY